MKITTEQIISFQNQFQLINSKEDFLLILNEAKKIIYTDKYIPFEEKQLNYYINQQHKNPYNTFIIKKKSGADRTIKAPCKGLKEFQKALNIIIQSIHQPHSAATGFVPNKSIVHNAKVHIGQYYVYNIDLKDFFPSIDQARVWGRLKAAPFNLGSSPERIKIANMMATLTCTAMEVERYIENQWVNQVRSVLPQGAPTSPTLTNAICEKLDKRLAGVAKRFGLNYTRYADDITFSSKHNTFKIAPGTVENIFESNSTFEKEIRKIITQQSFHIKESKVRLQKQGYRQEVTGLTVNDKVNVSRRYIKQLRQWLYYWETYGYQKAYSFFIQQYLVDKGHVKKSKPNMMLVLDGKLLYLKMVKGERDNT